VAARRGTSATATAGKAGKASKASKAGKAGKGRQAGAILRVTQVKSTISHIERNRGTVRARGLKHIGHTVDVPANDATRGMVRAIRFLVDVEEVPGAGPEEKA
jgi:large subunit ribosomal protein L30